MLPLGSFIGSAATMSGFLAAPIAIGGFLGQVWPALRRRDHPEVRAATVVGGLGGLVAAALAAIGSSLW
ncbi:MAG: hypothetical protein ACTHK3_10240 [Solirubrobacterales bacterium]